MELKKRLSLGKIFVGLYILAFLVYLAIGLQPAEAVRYDVTSNLVIPSINLTSDVAMVEISEDGLTTPDTIVGEYKNHKNKTFLFGHSSTVFKDLDGVKIGDVLEYNSQKYEVINKTVLKKERIDMKKILAETKKKTVAIMTCAGEDLGGGDATHRLILTAVAID